MRFNENAEALYGLAGTVYLDGSTPAALSGLDARLPQWRRDDRIIYLDAATSGLDQLELPATFSTLDSDTPTVIRGGGNVWAMYDATNDEVTSSHPLTLAGARLGDINFAGQLAVVSDGAASGPISVYAAAGTLLREISTTVSSPSTIRVVEDYIVWQDSGGHWNLYDFVNDSTPTWVPQAQAVNAMVPVTMLGTLYLIEQTSSGLTIRPADNNQAYTLRSSSAVFGIDAMVQAVGASEEIVAGCCTDGQETQNSLEVFKASPSATGNTFSVVIGTISGGAIVYGAAQTISPGTVVVGPPAGTTIGTATTLPNFATAAISQKNQDGQQVPTREFLYAWNTAMGAIQQIGSVVNSAPVPVVPPPGGGGGSGGSGIAYSQVASTGQPTMAASSGNVTLNLESSDGSLGIVLSPATNTADLTVEGGSWIPLVDGSEPPNFITDGAGHLILVAYP